MKYDDHIIINSSSTRRKHGHTRGDQQQQKRIEKKNAVAPSCSLFSIHVVSSLIPRRKHSRGILRLLLVLGVSACLFNVVYLTNKHLYEKQAFLLLFEGTEENREAMMNRPNAAKHQQVPTIHLANDQAQNATTNTPSQKNRGQEELERRIKAETTGGFLGQGIAMQRQLQRQHNAFAETTKRWDKPFPKKLSLPVGNPKPNNIKGIKYAFHGDDPTASLHYAPQRIPGYINVWGTDTRALYGYVMRDLTTRICSREIASSNILVVSPEAPLVVQLLLQNTTGNKNSPTIKRHQDELAWRQRVNHTVGGCTLVHVHMQGHTYHGLDNRTRLDDWWQHFDSNQNNHSVSSDKLNHLNKDEPHRNKPNWILLAMVDHGPQNDNIIANARTLIKESTITYMVVGIGVYPSPTTITESKDVTSPTIPATIQMYGKQAIRHLIHLKYKVQLLSLSHMSTRWYFETSKDRNNSTNYYDNDLYRPNADITLQIIDRFFRELALEANQTGTPILGYVFATQGLDLAIPTSTEYHPTIDEQRRIVEYKQCRKTNLHLSFGRVRADGKMRVTCDHHTVKKSDVQEKWKSAKEIENSEAVCIRMSCEQKDRSDAACATRIIPKRNNISAALQHALSENASTNSPHQRKPNLLVLMMDPISQQRFQRSLIKTNRLLKFLNFTSFTRYTAVGNNSGPNQAALYAGKALDSRDTIAAHDQKTKGGQWLWDTLRNEGYATFKAENGCVENSNMIQSIRPRVDHGDALQRMMCFDFQRPNCVGQIPAAQYLLNYGTQFIQAYNNDQQQQPWAAFLHFIDSHEDTMTLEGTLDDLLWKFLFSIYSRGSSNGESPYPNSTNGMPDSDENRIPCNVWDDTILILMSDHGLHYGNYLLSPKGLQERSRPMLHVHLPKNMENFDSAVHALQNNRDKWTTPFDVYETLSDALLSETRFDSSWRQQSKGTTLLRRLEDDRQKCNTTKGIPLYICDILELNQSSSAFTMMPNPPSVMSFYADIPHWNKKMPQTDACKSNNSEAYLFSENVSCVCATNVRPWHNCTAHPWKNSTTSLEGETFSMIDCGSERLYQVQVNADSRILSRPEIIRAKASGAATARPNILFLELDSVSQAYADRHFPRTRELLDSMRLRRRGKDESYLCGKNNTLCSVEFPKFSVTGASSIPNQVAVLSGCVVTTGPELCDDLQLDHMNRTICNNKEHPVYGMQLVNRHNVSVTFCRVDEKGRSPWLFDIAKAAGYVTLFAEEFCYDDSVYVPQGNIFELDADILPHKFFCRNVERRAAKMGFQINGPIWSYEDSSNPGKPCVDGKGSFRKAAVAMDHIESMWGAYAGTPKFAYLNAMAAHVYGSFKT